MQLREVGKPAAYLWKMRWLQKPGSWAHHFVLFGSALHCGVPKGATIDDALTCSTRWGLRPAPVTTSGQLGTVAVRGNPTV
jgi:hypothetical protein